MPPALHPPALRLPRIANDTLTLRAFEDRDAPAVMSASTDPLIPLITTVPPACGLAGALAFVGRQHERAATGTGYSLAIALARDDRAVGQIGLWPGQDGRASVGYWVEPGSRGLGVATGALRLLSAWGLQLPGVERLELYVEPWNEGSWRAAERAGYQREGLLRSWQTVGDERRDMLMYSLLPTDDV
ncbi:GNAT family N-acetyltransferase [Cellulomonas sp. 179-A 4D5 NHS]|uniref:GNAT family N-acetyltransferase n=1 Tax=Cellulomonas sp. 179-A 4D5 NHS TaxID=3142378 RepID=UPI0039A004EC